MLALPLSLKKSGTQELDMPGPAGYCCQRTKKAVSSKGGLGYTYPCHPDMSVTLQPGEEMRSHSLWLGCSSFSPYPTGEGSPPGQSQVP